MAFVAPVTSTTSKKRTIASCSLRRSSFIPRVSSARVQRQCTANLTAPRMTRTERTFIAVKPDGMNRGILGNIISRFEVKGYKLVGIKTLVPSKQLAEEHYSALKEKPFFNDLVDFITSGPVCAMVWEGEQVVVTARKMIGETNPLSSAPGTIRGDFAVDVGRKSKGQNSSATPKRPQFLTIDILMFCVRISGSDAVETAQREISLWFDQGELTEWEPTASVWIYE